MSGGGGMCGRRGEPRQRRCGRGAERRRPRPTGPQQGGWRKRSTGERRWMREIRMHKEEDAMRSGTAMREVDEDSPMRFFFLFFGFGGRALVG